MWRRPAMLRAAAYREGVKYDAAHAKLDGHRVMVSKDGDGRVTALTRNFVDLAPKLTCVEWAERVPVRTAVDGELVVPGGTASDVKTRLHEARFEAFAVPWWAGRRLYDSPVRVARHLCQTNGIAFAAPLLEFWAPEAWDMAAAARAWNVEGWVLKRSNYRGWWKWKLERTIDLLVTGIKPGQGKYSGTVGALLCSFVDDDGSHVEVASVSGMTDEQRARMGRHDIGRVVEVRYQQVGSLGRLRHPRFVRWRDDKDAEGCRADQDPDLRKETGR